jgi:peptide/bleomycin uptake transporter
MFVSFFPRPKLLFVSAVIWTLVCVAIWYASGRDLSKTLSLASLIGVTYPPTLAAGARDLWQAVHAAAADRAIDLWLYQYTIVAGALFAAAWAWIAPHRWFRWSR